MDALTCANIYVHEKVGLPHVTHFALFRPLKQCTEVVVVSCFEPLRPRGEEPSGISPAQTPPSSNICVRFALPFPGVSFFFFPNRLRKIVDSVSIPIPIPSCMLAIFAFSTSLTMSPFLLSSLGQGWPVFSKVPFPPRKKKSNVPAGASSPFPNFNSARGPCTRQLNDCRSSVACK